MNRILLLVACLLLTACASGVKQNNFVRSTGEGYTFEQAKQNAFTNAMEQHLGVVIASERESQGEKLARNEILAYSAGYVDEYTIISQQINNGRVVVVVDVKISSNKISDRILSSSKSNKGFDGLGHDNQYKSYLTNKENGDNILQRVLNDYPKHAYNIKQNNYTVKIDTYRNLTLVVPYEIGWNPNYIASLNDSIKLVQDGSNGLMRKSPATIRVNSTTFYFNEFIIPNRVLDAVMDDNEVRISLTITDQYNRIQYRECFVPDAVFRRVKPFYEINYVRTINAGFYNNGMEKGSIELKIQNNSHLDRVMKNLNNIELSIVAKRSCQKNN
jgi:hypothetical protein